MKSFWIVLMMTAALAAPCVFAQTAPYTPQRTPEGLPDLEGIWQPQTNGAAYSILPHLPDFFWAPGRRWGSSRAVFCRISRGRRNE